MKPEEIRKKRTKKAKISFAAAGILCLLVLISWFQTYLEVQYLPTAVSVIFGYFFPFLTIPFVITGIWNFAIRNRLSKNEKNENKIKQLEERLNEFEGDSESPTKTE